LGSFSPLFAPPTAGARGNPFGCVGDCNQTGQVELHELLRCSLGALHGPDRALGCFDVCDANGDGVITIDELVLAVNDAEYDSRRPSSVPGSVQG
jgi:hypothetical protein